MSRVLKAEVDSSGKVHFLPLVSVSYRRPFHGVSIRQGWILSRESFTSAERAEVHLPALDERLLSLHARLQQLKQLEANWDLHGAAPIDPSVLTYVMTFLSRVIDRDVPLPQIVPRVRGTVQLEWHTKSKDLEVYLDAPEVGSFLFEDVDRGVEREGNIRTDLPKLKEILHELNA